MTGSLAYVAPQSLWVEPRCGVYFTLALSRSLALHGWIPLSIIHALALCGLIPLSVVHRIWRLYGNCSLVLVVVDTVVPAGIPFRLRTPSSVAFGIAFSFPVSFAALTLEEQGVVFGVFGGRRSDRV